MGMKAGQIFPAFPTNKFHLPKYFRGVFLRGKGSIIILLIMGSHQDIFGYFDKMLGIAALLAGNATGRFTSWNMEFLHRSQ